MKSLRKIALLTTQIIAVLLIAALVYFSTGSVTIINESSSTIESGLTAIRDSRHPISTLKPGEKLTIWFGSDEGDHYDVSIKLASGTELSDRLGYICIGNANRDRIIVSDTGLRAEFSNGPLEIWTIMHGGRGTEQSAERKLGPP